MPSEHRRGESENQNEERRPESVEALPEPGHEVEQMDTDEAAGKVEELRGHAVAEAKEAADAFTSETIAIEPKDIPLLPAEKSAFALLKETAADKEREVTAKINAIAEEGTETGIEKKEKELLRRSFEYRDSEGRLLGSAEIALSDEEVEVDEMTVGKKEKGRGRALQSFVLRGEKDGKPTEVDVMALINPHGAEIVVASSRLDNYSYNDEKKRAIVPMPETPLDIGVVMHELGHTDQHHEERFASVSPLYELGKSANADAYAPLSDVKKKIAEVIAAVPEASSMMEPGVLSELEALQADKSRAFSERNDREEARNERITARDALLQSLLSRTVEGALPEGFTEDVSRTFKELRQDWDENKWKEKGPEYVATLERSGFHFAAEMPAAKPERPMRRSFEKMDEETEAHPTMPLPKEKATDIESMRSIVRRFKSGVDIESTPVSYSKEEKRLKVKAPFPPSGELRDYHLELDLPLSEEDFAAYEAARASAEADLATAEKALADATDALKEAGRKQRERMEQSNLRDIIKLPMRMLERDATRRAYQWMRKVKQDAGVDLFAAHKAHAETTLPGIREARKTTPENCESSAASALEPGNEALVETDVIENLDIGLQSYGAEHPPLKKRGT